MALNAVVEPMFMRARRREIATVMPIEYRGRAEWGSTCKVMTVRSEILRKERIRKGLVSIHTLASQRDPGRPLSRANAQVMREAVAIKPIVAKKTNARMTQTMAVAPPGEFVA